MQSGAANSLILSVASWTRNSRSYPAASVSLVSIRLSCHRAAMANHARSLFWLAVLTTVLFAWAPHPPALIPNDKLQHLLAFVVLALLMRFSYPAIAWQVTGLALAAVGALIEIVQAISVLHRDCDIYDWYADVAAIVLGLVIATAIRRLQVSREP
jgi:fermentation-respiration switch protein FrsA (DUF1100 family)